MGTSSASSSSVSRADIAAAIAAFEANDLPILDALSYLTVAIDRKRFLELRQRGTSEAAGQVREMLRDTSSAMLLEHGVALNHAAAGDHEAALATRLEALRCCPRYDAWLSALLLSGIASSLLALDRAEEALPLAERALRFQPLEPRPMVILARARGAVGDDAGAARVRAWLFDRAIGPAILPGGPTAADRAATPYQVDLSKLEPMTDAEMGRYLVLFRTDVGLAGTLAGGRRHIAAQLRHGDLAAARLSCGYYAGGSPAWSDAVTWVGMPSSLNTEYVATDALLGAVREEASRRKLKPKPADLAHRLAGVRVRAIRELAAEGGAVPRSLLTDLIWDVALEARRALPNDPVVTAAAASERETGVAPRIFGADPPEGDLVPHTLGQRDHFLLDGVRLSYPVEGAKVSREGVDDWVPFIEAATDARAKCKVCKAAIEAGALRLVVRAKLFPVETKFVHIACASQKRFASALNAASARSRLDLK